jgi:hypothetical protein
MRIAVTGKCGQVVGALRVARRPAEESSLVCAERLLGAA